MKIRESKAFSLNLYVHMAGPRIDRQHTLGFDEKELKVFRKLMQRNQHG